MDVLYVALRHDYGDPERGLSAEHHLFYDSLRKMGQDILYFDIGAIGSGREKSEQNERLQAVVAEEKPDLLFSVLYPGALQPETVRHITENTDTTTVNWFTDDHFKFESFSKPWAPRFDAVVTTSTSAYERYQAEGIGNVIKSQWACNPFLFDRRAEPKEHDVSFVGQAHSDRAQIIGRIRAAGFPVETRGYGWEQGRVGQDQMIEIFNRSKINLNFARASRPPPRDQTFLQTCKYNVAELLNRHPLGQEVKKRLKSLVGTNSSSGADRSQRPLQIKSRNFEVPGCGGFLLTNEHEELEDYYEPGKEVATFSDIDHLIEQIDYYLDDDEERSAMAQAAYRRTRQEHTFAHRFESIFDELGLPFEIPASVWEGTPVEGSTRHVTGKRV